MVLTTHSRYITFALLPDFWISKDASFVALGMWRCWTLKATAAMVTH